MKEFVAGRVVIGGRGSGRGAQRAVLVTALLLAVAIVKPWGTGPNLAVAQVPNVTNANPSLADDGAGVPMASTFVPAAPEPSLGPTQIRCLSGTELVSLVHLGTWTVRDWQPVAPMATVGPLDPQVPVVALNDGVLRGLGVCAGGTDAIVPDLHIVGAWRIGGSPATAVAVPIVELPGWVPVSGSDSDPSPLAHLYRPLKSAAGASWPNGRYALEVGSSDPDVPHSWVGIVVGPSSPKG